MSSFKTSSLFSLLVASSMVSFVKPAVALEIINDDPATKTIRLTADFSEGITGFATAASSLIFAATSDERLNKLSNKKQYIYDENQEVLRLERQKLINLASAQVRRGDSVRITREFQGAAAQAKALGILNREQETLRSELRNFSNGKKEKELTDRLTKVSSEIERLKTANLKLVTPVVSPTEFIPITEGSPSLLSEQIKKLLESEPGRITKIEVNTFENQQKLLGLKKAVKYGKVGSVIGMSLMVDSLTVKLIPKALAGITASETSVQGGLK